MAWLLRLFECSPTARWLGRAAPMFCFLVLAWAPGCGEVEWGGVRDDAFYVTSTALPQTNVGRAVSHLIPLTGRVDGPYELRLLGGQLPPGVRLHDATRQLLGAAERAGT